VDQCWAKALGDCAGGMTAEHIISEALFEGKELGIKGMHWCREEHRFIGKANFTSNMLCRKHNNDLSEIADRPGIAAFAILRSVAAIARNRADMLKMGLWVGRFDDIEHAIDGTGFERWLLKTLINMEIAGRHGLPVGRYAGSAVAEPELVEIAFGRKSFRDKAGLYFAGFHQETINMDEHVQYVSWISEDQDHRYVGVGAFVFHGLRFFVCLEPEGLPDEAQMDGRKLRLLHHVRTINVEVERRASQHIEFSWQ
jgi:hypothetical protein